jgi:uncharacterized protein YcbK (DUF882 family)
MKLLKHLGLVVLALALLQQPAAAMTGETAGLNHRLMGLLWHIQNHFGRSVTIVSGCRSHSHNRRIGGARESFHLRCLAADIKVQGVGKAQLAKYARSLAGRGGVGVYCRDGSVHIDVGPRREWYWTCNGKHLNSGLPAHSRIAIN